MSPKTSRGKGFVVPSRLGDISVRAGKGILVDAPMRKRAGRVELSYCGAWLRLCRTDLLDNVCTFDAAGDAKEELETCRKKYLNKISLGVRLGEEHFACIDAYTDG